MAILSSFCGLGLELGRGGVILFSFCRLEWDLDGRVSLKSILVELDDYS
jgi:hypothetical protein